MGRDRRRAESVNWTSACPGRAEPPGRIALLVKDVGDFGIDVIVEELVDEFDDLGLGLDLLRGGLGI